MKEKSKQTLIQQYKMKLFFNLNYFLLEHTKQKGATNVEFVSLKVFDIKIVGLLRQWKTQGF